MVDHIYTYIDPPSQRHLERACQILTSGGILAYPMDVNWAIGCDAANIKALDKIHRLKPHHPKEQPFSLICHNISMASGVGNIDQQMYRILKKAWPGPYTFIMKRNKTLPRQIKDKRQVVGIRIPDSPLVLSLVEMFGSPLATTSMPIRPDGTGYQMGYQIVEDFGHGLDLVLDLGQELPGLESTVVDLTLDTPVVVRLGVGDTSFLAK